MVHDDRPARILVRGEPRLAVGDQFVGPGRRARAKRGEGDHALSEFRVGHADHGRLSDGRVGQERPSTSPGKTE